MKKKTLITGEVIVIPTYISYSSSNIVLKSHSVSKTVLVALSNSFYFGNYLLTQLPATSYLAALLADHFALSRRLGHKLNFANDRNTRSETGICQQSMIVLLTSDENIILTLFNAPIHPS